MNNTTERVYNRIANKLPVYAAIFALVLLLGFLFMERPEYTYTLTADQMLVEVLPNKSMIEPGKFAEILYNNDSLYRFIDLRSPHDFIKGHLPGALNIPIHTLLDKEVQDILNQDTYINVLYYSDHCGACGPWMLLTQMGYKNNKLLLGGYDFVKPNVMDEFKPMSGEFLNEKPKYDFAQLLNSGTVASETTAKNERKPVVMKKKASKTEEGGC